jgi:hypothetical protein
LIEANGQEEKDTDKFFEQASAVVIPAQPSAAVIPAKAGIHVKQFVEYVDPGLRRDDGA